MSALQSIKNTLETLESNKEPLQYNVLYQQLKSASSEVLSFLATESWRLYQVLYRDVSTPKHTDYCLMCLGFLAQEERFAFTETQTETFFVKMMSIIRIPDISRKSLILTGWCMSCFHLSDDNRKGVQHKLKDIVEVVVKNFLLNDFQSASLMEQGISSLLNLVKACPEEMLANISLWYVPVVEILLQSDQEKIIVGSLELLRQPILARFVDDVDLRVPNELSTQLANLVKTIEIEKLSLTQLKSQPDIHFIIGQILLFLDKNLLAQKLNQAFWDYLQKTFADKSSPPNEVVTALGAWKYQIRNFLASSRSFRAGKAKGRLALSLKPLIFCLSNRNPQVKETAWEVFCYLHRHIQSSDQQFEKMEKVFRVIAEEKDAILQQKFFDDIREIMDKDSGIENHTAKIIDFFTLILKDRDVTKEWVISFSALFEHMMAKGNHNQYTLFVQKLLSQNKDSFLKRKLIDIVLKHGKEIPYLPIAEWIQKEESTTESTFINLFEDFLSTLHDLTISNIDQLLSTINTSKYESKIQIQLWLNLAEKIMRLLPNYQDDLDTFFVRLLTDPLRIVLKDQIMEDYHNFVVPIWKKLIFAYHSAIRRGLEKDFQQDHDISGTEIFERMRLILNTIIETNESIRLRYSSEVDRIPRIWMNLSMMLFEAISETHKSLFESLSSSNELLESSENYIKAFLNYSSTLLIIMSNRNQTEDNILAILKAAEWIPIIGKTLEDQISQFQPLLSGPFFSQFSNLENEIQETNIKTSQYNLWKKFSDKSSSLSIEWDEEKLDLMSNYFTIGLSHFNRSIRNCTMKIWSETFRGRDLPYPEVLKPVLCKLGLIASSQNQNSSSAQKLSFPVQSPLIQGIVTPRNTFLPNRVESIPTRKREQRKRKRDSLELTNYDASDYVKIPTQKSETLEMTDAQLEKYLERKMQSKRRRLLESFETNNSPLILSPLREEPQSPNHHEVQLSPGKKLKPLKKNDPSIVYGTAFNVESSSEVIDQLQCASDMIDQLDGQDLLQAHQLCLDVLQKIHQRFLQRKDCITDSCKEKTASPSL